MDYRISHQAPGLEDGYGSTLDNMRDVMPDVYEHPEWYGHGDDREACQAVRDAQGRPDARIRVYRAAPAGTDVLNTGDWVSTSLEYARQHAIQDDDPANDWPVIVATVTAGELVSEGNDLCEYGYSGQALTGLPIA